VNRREDPVPSEPPAPQDLMPKLPPHLEPLPPLHLVQSNVVWGAWMAQARCQIGRENPPSTTIV
jgi:hypothetical protein